MAHDLGGDMRLHLSLGLLGVVFFLSLADNGPELNISGRAVDETSSATQYIVVVGFANGTKAHGRHLQDRTIGSGLTVVGGGVVAAVDGFLFAVGRPEGLHHKGSRLASLALST